MLLHLFRGGNEVGPVTLLNFYNFHTAILPLIMVVLMVFHFWKVRKAGGVVVPGGKINENKEYVSAIPDFVAREFVFALVLIALVLFISVIWNAPLLERANPALSPNPAKAPWYFLGIQELLMHFHPLFAAFIIPVLFLAIIVWLPFSRFKTKNSGIWFASDNGRKLCIKTTVFTLLIIPGLIVANEFIPDFIETASGALAVIGNGLVPLTIILVSLALWIYWLSKKAGYSKNEIVQAVFVFLVVSYLILMFTSIWFRGEGMALCWPWEV
jgi:quinol-cytochrome oxidoreductase complex cytochrome b subunit